MKKASAKSKYDASDLVGKIVFPVANVAGIAIVAVVAVVEATNKMRNGRVGGHRHRRRIKPM